MKRPKRAFTTESQRHGDNRHIEKPSSKHQRLRGRSIGTKAQRAEIVRDRIAAVIRSIPRGKVSTYGAIGRAAGLPNAARLVARVLQRGIGLPWQRVLGSGGAIKLTGDSAMEQRFRLEAEGVRFRGRRVDMKAHEWKWPKKRRK